MLDEANADARPAWFDYCDRPRLAGFKGRTHLRLAQPQAAHTVLEEAPDGGRARIATLPAARPHRPVDAPLERVRRMGRAGARVWSPGAIG